MILMVPQDLPEPTILDNKLLNPKTDAEITYKEKRKIDLALKFLENRKFKYDSNMGHIHSALKVKYSDLSKSRWGMKPCLKRYSVTRNPYNIWIWYRRYITTKKASNILWSISAKQPNKSITWHSIVTIVKWII